MAATLTGTAQTLNSSSSSGSNSITVPSDAEAIVVVSTGVWKDNWDSDPINFSKLNFDNGASNDFTLITQNPSGGGADPPLACAYIITDESSDWPGTGSKTLYWEYNCGAFGEGGTKIVYYVKGLDTSSPVRDSDNEIHETSFLTAFSGVDAGDLCFISACQWNAAPDATPSGYDQTTLASGNYNSNYYEIGYEAGEDAMYATCPNSSWNCFVAFALKVGSSVQTLEVTGSGGIILGGSATVAFEKTLSVTGSGGIVLGGAAVLEQGKVETMSGGIVLGGAADVVFQQSLSVDMAGGIIFGGAADVAFERSLTVTMDGGLVLGGSAGLEFGRVIVGAGGIIFGGAADYAFEEQASSLEITGSGGIVFGGAADVEGWYVWPRAGGGKGGGGGFIASEPMVDVEAIRRLARIKAERETEERCVLAMVKMFLENEDRWGL